jgi:hypothetical protein
VRAKPVELIRDEKPFGEGLGGALSEELPPLGRDRVGVARVLLEHGLGVGRVLAVEQQVVPRLAAQEVPRACVSG